ncbi:MAG: hypothetical protein LBH20_06755 [Treponema sp.]|nr:hypothetical protein [Treponema sp.]
MKKKTMCFVIVLTLVGLNCLSAQMTKTQLQEMYVSFLKGEGYNPSVDKDGDVNFTAQGQKFYIDVMADDLQSFRIVLSEFLPMGSNRLKALEAAASEIATTKAISFNLASNNRLAINSFIFIARPEDFKTHVKRMVDNMLIAKRDFLAKL